MAVTILETIKSAANAGNTAYIVILQLLCDTAADLPTQYSLTGYELAQGCKAHVIDTNTDYMLDSNGTWHISGSEIWQNVYSKTETDTLLSGKQDTLTTAQLDAVNSRITAAKVQQYDETVTDEAEDRAALVELVDEGAKNLLKNALAGTSSTKYAVTATFDANGVGTISGTNNSATNDSLFSIVESLSLPVGHYHASGCPSGGAIGKYRIDFVSSTGSVYRDIGNGVVFDIAENETIRVQFVVYRGKTSPTETVQPMICTAADWAVSQKFVPYCPSMAEMYQMILALQ